MPRGDTIRLLCTALVAMSCGARSGLEYGTSDVLPTGALDARPESGTDAAPSVDVDVGAPCSVTGPRPPPPTGPCMPLSFSVGTQASCPIERCVGDLVDADAFISTDAGATRVFAIGRWGRGRFLAYADETTLGTLLSRFDVRRTLGGRSDARVLAIGYATLCDPARLSSVPSWVRYSGTDLPVQYRGNAAALAADAEILLVCASHIESTYDATPELTAFVTQHGRAVIVVMDYFRPPGGITSLADFARVNTWLGPTGLRFTPETVEHATMTVSACVP